MNIKELQELNEIAIRTGKKYVRKREIYNILYKDTGRHFTAVIGPRGSGKTILLQQLATNIEKSFYLSCDTLGDGDLFETIQNLHMNYGISHVMIDEIHFQPNYHESLKKIFDFLDVRIHFTSSVALSLFESSYDLSRRIRQVFMFPFSMREYVFFKAGEQIAPLTMDSLITGKFDESYMRFEYLFDGYLKGGLLPFSLEEPDILPLLRNVLHSVITRDIPSVARLEVHELAVLEKLVSFVAHSSVDGVNYSSIARNVGITRYKAEQYVDLLNKSFILNPVFPAGANVLREPKILMCLPYRLLFTQFEESLGGLREDFFAETMRMAGNRIQYLKSTRGVKTPDFLVARNSGDIIIEVGGKNKGRSQFKGVEGKKSLILSHQGVNEGIRRPLFIIGFIV